MAVLTAVVAHTPDSDVGLYRAVRLIRRFEERAVDGRAYGDGGCYAQGGKR